MTRLAVVAQQVLDGQISAVIERAGGMPVLMAYSSDGTPMSVHQKHSAKLGKRTVKREGKGSKEFLAQVLFVRFLDARGKSISACHIPAPVPLTHDKTAAAIYSAAFPQLRLLRQRGHDGIAVQHFCFDRANFGALSRMFKQHCEVLF